MAALSSADSAAASDNDAMSEIDHASARTPPDARSGAGRPSLRSVAIYAGERPCTALDQRSLRAQRGFERVELHFECPRDSGLRLRISTFFEVVPSHTHFARVRVDHGRPIEHLLTSDRHEVAVTADPVLRDITPA